MLKLLPIVGIKAAEMADIGPLTQNRVALEMWKMFYHNCKSKMHVCCSSVFNSCPLTTLLK